MQRPLLKAGLPGIGGLQLAPRHAGGRSFAAEGRVASLCGLTGRGRRKSVPGAENGLDKAREAIYSRARYSAPRYHVPGQRRGRRQWSSIVRVYWETLINRSVSRFFLLAALHQHAMHGYELAKAISEAAAAAVSPATP